MLKRLSTLGIPPPERPEPPASVKSGGKAKCSLATLSQLRVPLPTRTPVIRKQTEATALKSPLLGPNHQRNPVVMPGTSRQLYFCSPALPNSSVLDGIAALPPTNSDKKRVLRSASKKIPKRKSTSSSKIPLAGTKRVGPTSNNKSSLVPKASEAETLRQTMAKKKEPVSSPSTLDSTAVFEADELAMRCSTPGVERIPATPSAARKCSCNVAKALEDGRKLFETLARENKEALSSVLAEQKKCFLEYTGLIEQQKRFYAENSALVKEQKKLVEAQVEMMSELKKLFPSHSHDRLTEDEDVDMSGEREKENTLKPIIEESPDATTPTSSSYSLQQYNDIRAVFNSLSLRTPLNKTRTGARMFTPKTPKSIMSRALQQQLGDLFSGS